MTANRPALLERALNSYIHCATTAHNEVEYVVFDDSKDSTARDASHEVAKKIRRQVDAVIRFAGHQERTAYVQQLVEHLGGSGEILKRTLLRSEGYTLGQNRNALLLDSVGALYFGADDDTICVVATPPEPAQQLRLCEGMDPSEYWCFGDITEARAAVRYAVNDVLGAHEQLLGRNTREMAAPSAGPGTALQRRIDAAESTVRVTLNGLLGDCAWGSPFGLWHQPMGYLAFEGASLERLAGSQDHYRQRLESRQLLRVTPSPVLSDSAFSMLTTWGLDNRKMLPPNLPAHRGQDLVFGQVLRACCNKTIIGHIPLALVHEPVPARRFWPGEITRTAAGIDLCRLMIEAIACCDFRDDEISAGDRLMALGRHLVRLATLPGNALRNQMTQHLHKSNRCFERTLTQRAQQTSSRDTHYAQDVARYFNKLRTSQARADYWLPLDLWGADGSAGAEARTRQSLREFGELLEAWPSIDLAARTLRDAGVRVSVTV